MDFKYFVDFSHICNASSLHTKSEQDIVLYVNIPRTRQDKHVNNDSS